MSEAERPDRTALGTAVTVDDVRELTGAATPHFALQIRNRVGRLIQDLPRDHPARLVGEREIRRLAELGREGETRGRAAQPGMPPMPSVVAPSVHRP